jgi:hypothetical protein
MRRCRRDDAHQRRVDPFARLNIFDDPVPWNRVRVAGLLILATATKFNGFKVEDVWKMQKSKSASGAVFSFNGTNPVGGESGFSIAFRVTSRDEFDQLYDLYDALKPVDVVGGGGGGASNGTSTTAATYSVGSPAKPASDATAESLLAQAEAAMKSINSTTPAASSQDAADKQTAATTPTPSPGPRPPTVPIELGWLAFLSVFAVARKSFEFSTIEQDNLEVTIGFIHDQPPKPAGAGAMAAPKSPAAKYVDTAASAASAAAKKGAAGT